MSFQFQPLTEKELNELDKSSLLEEGIYDFEIIKCTKGPSKAGNPMATLELKIWDKEGDVHFVYDYLVFSTVPLNIRKVKHFCDSVGLQEEYKKGELPESLVSYCGKALIKFKESLPNPQGGHYRAKIFVEDYVMTDKGATKYDGMKPLPEAKDEFFDDRLPF